MPRLAMKIHPLNCKSLPQGKMTNERSTLFKTKLRRIFERQFQSTWKNNMTETSDFGESSSKSVKVPLPVEGSGIDHGPSSACLAEMVHDFLENEEETANCFCGHFSAERNPDGEDDRKSPLSSAEISEILKSLLPCPSPVERNLLADASKFWEEVNDAGGIKLCKDKDVCTNRCLKRALMSWLRSKGYNAAICSTKWDQANRYPAGEYEYIDVLAEVKGKYERIIVDMDFRSQFEIARSTSHYKLVLQMLPVIFVGQADRLQQIISIVCDAAKQSLKKKHMHIPPWRRVEYMQAKWLSPIKRTIHEDGKLNSPVEKGQTPSEVASIEVKGSAWGKKLRSDLDLQIEGNGILSQPIREKGWGNSSPVVTECKGQSESSDRITVVVSEWQPPAVKPKSVQKGGKIAAGLASMLREAGLSSKSSNTFTPSVT